MLPLRHLSYPILQYAGSRQAMALEIELPPRQSCPENSAIGAESGHSRPRDPYGRKSRRQIVAR